MLNRIIFLDIDGVLNNAKPPPAGDQRPMIDPANVAPLNQIIHFTAAKVVISSTWRQMIRPGFMTFKGFEQMLLTHRVRCEVAGATDLGSNLRGDQIDGWLEGFLPGLPGGEPFGYVALDDDDDGITALGHPLVHVDGRVGLTVADADRAIALLAADAWSGAWLEAHR